MLTVPKPPVLSLERVSRSFRGVPAVSAVSLDVAAGEFFSLLGPSGCGKTTTLRLIAGFEDPDPDGGTIRMLGESVIGTRPYQRPIGMVFQNYALFPHLSVAHNIAFGLEEHRVAKAEILARVTRALELVRLDPATYADRRPSELSGGQRQRVALARALVLEPKILLLDEPLGALDLQLRKEMQLELRRLNRALGITFIIVTHDQEEALAMSDRVAVMSAGRVVQVGTPAEIYERPRTAFVARFIGEANVLSGFARGAGGEAAQVAVRPERMTLAPTGTPTDANALRGTIREIIFLGEALHIMVTVDGGAEVRVAVRNPGMLSTPITWRVGEAVQVTWQSGDAHVLDS